MARGTPSEFPRDVFAARRHALGQALGDDELLLVCAGRSVARNYAANPFPFRASSHFLHFVGLPFEHAVLAIARDGAMLFVVDASADDALWHGPSPSRGALAETLGLPVESRANLETALRGRVVHLAPGHVPGDESFPFARPTDDGERRLADALVASRLRHDAYAMRELRRAAALTALAHRAGMGITRPGISAAVPRAVMEAVFTMNGATTAYGSIVTPRGEVLHAGPSSEILAHGDLLLCDVGAEVASGYAADVTRTFPVNGTFSSEARAIYDVVLAAQSAAIESVAIGMRYRDVHTVAMRALASGLVELGMLRGNPEERVADRSVSVFFPHGIGHLLGLDVHDMEDLGDRAGYAEGRVRATDRAYRYLRLDRDLENGMAFTIEPGIYFVPAILDDSDVRREFAGRIDFEVAEAYRTVSGIRIEDDVCLVDGRAEVLTANAPKRVSDLEDAVGIGVDWDAVAEARSRFDEVDTGAAPGLGSAPGTIR